MKTGAKRTGKAECRKNEGVKKERGQKGNRTEKEGERIRGEGNGEKKKARGT